MRILLPMHLISPWSREIALRLADLGHEIHVFDFCFSEGTAIGYFTGPLLKPDLKEFKSRVRVHQTRPPFRSKFNYLFFCHCLKKISKENGIEVILALSCGGYAAMTYLSGFRPYVLYVTGSDILLPSGVSRYIKRHILKQAGIIFSNGHYLGYKTQELAKRDVHILCIGVDTDRFAAPHSKPNRCTILCTRGFLPVYNNEYLIKSLVILSRTATYDRVIFSSTGPTLETCKTMAGQLLPQHVREKVFFLEGLTAKDLMTYLMQASIFVSMARSDGTPISLLEAMSCGLFPVVSDIPQNREWIYPELGNGILVPLDQPNELANALETAIRDNALRDRAIAINRKMVMEKADSRKNMAVLARKMEELIEITE